jgi:uncharacterized protein
MTDFAFPLTIAEDGSSAVADNERHIRDMIELILFTRRGERVNRADFGAGVNELLFSENAPELAAAAQHMVQAALQQWLGHLIDVLAVNTGTDGSMLTIVVNYRSRGDDANRSVTFRRAQ